MRTEIRLLILALWLPCSTLWSQFTLTLTVNGKPVKELPRKDRFREKNDFPQAAMRHAYLKSVLEKWVWQGYPEAEADSLGGDSLHLNADIRTGPRYRNFRIRPGNVDLTILPPGWAKESFSSHFFKSPDKILKKVTEAYENNGYPFASVRIDSLSISPERTEILLACEKGPLVKIDSVEIRGNALLKKSFLHAYLGIKPGNVYQEKNLRRIEQRLKELPFIRIEQPHRVEFTDPEHVRVVIFAKKVNASRFNGLIGFMPGSANGRLLVTGEADLGLWNALGYGEQLTLRWRRIQAGTQSLQAFVKYPYILGTPLAVNGTFDFFRRDSTFQNIQFGFGVQYLFVGTNYAEVFYRRDISQLIQADPFIQSGQLPESVDYTGNRAGLKLNFERYDYRLNPTRGYLIQTSLWGGNKNMRRRAGIPENAYDNIRLKTFTAGVEIKADVFFRLHRRVTLKPGVLAAHSINPYRFFNELYRIGGLNTLRGFDEESLYMSSYALGNVELRFLIEENSFVYAFLNGGWMESKTVQRYLRDLPYGFGAGVSFFTKAGFINLAYALGSSRGEPIRFRNGKIHLGFTGVF